MKLQASYDMNEVISYEVLSVVMLFYLFIMEQLFEFYTWFNWKIHVLTNLALSRKREFQCVENKAQKQ